MVQFLDFSVAHYYLVDSSLSTHQQVFTQQFSASENFNYLMKRHPAHFCTDKKTLAKDLVNHLNLLDRGSSTKL